MRRLGFLINPIAGMGGRVGLKGTDGKLEEALELGATPVAATQAGRMLARLRLLAEEAVPPQEIRWLAAGGAMGADALSAAGFAEIDIAHQPPANSGRDDTLAAAHAISAAGVELLVFCGGDGTARDVREGAGPDVPLVGIPSGVKMFSGVFATTPEHAADIVTEYLASRLELADAEILDLDEESYRHGEWRSKIFATAKTPFEPVYTQSAKSLIGGASEADAKEDIARFLHDEYADTPNLLLLLGAGSTVEAAGDAFGIDKTLLGIDAVADGEQVGTDLNEACLLDLLDRYDDVRLVVSPIGAQGFVLGRGTQQVSPAIIRRIGRDRLIIVSTPAKLAATPSLRFDSGDPALDAELRGDGFLPVVTGYRFSKRVKVAA
jgi:predicted polyphosphate/ATP-dependent NAD kinase